MSISISVEPIPPKLVDMGKFRLESLNALRREGTKQREELRKTTKDWQGDKPKFESKISLSGGDAQVRTGTAGSKHGQDKWKWLNEGTAVRRALLSPNWRSKTKPGTLRTGKGAGQVLAVGYQFAFDGIEARLWTDLVTKKRQKPFARDYGNVVKRYATYR